jgi:hypothetical protein
MARPSTVTGSRLPQTTESLLCYRQRNQMYQQVSIMHQNAINPSGVRVGEIRHLTTIKFTARETSDPLSHRRSS